MQACPLAAYRTSSAARSRRGSTTYIPVGVSINDDGIDRRIPARPRQAGRHDERRLKRLIHRDHAAYILVTLPGHGLAAQAQEQTRRQLKLGLGPQVKTAAQTGFQPGP